MCIIVRGVGDFGRGLFFSFFFYFGMREWKDDEVVWRIDRIKLDDGKVWEGKQFATLKT